MKTTGLKTLATLEESLGAKFFGAAVGLLVLSGVGLVLTADEFGWGDAFVLVGIGVVVVDGILEGAVFGPRTKKIMESTDDRTGDYIRLLTTGSVVHIVLLVFAVWAMVVKLGV